MMIIMAENIKKRLYHTRSLFTDPGNTNVKSLAPSSRNKILTILFASCF
jgi:hypothetical protein